MYRPVCTLVVILALPLLTACASERFTTDRLVRFVDEVFFGGPFDNNVFKNDLLVKWETPFDVGVAGVQADEHRAEVSERVMRMARVAGLSATMASGQQEADITVSFVPDESFEFNREYAGCFVHVEHQSGRIWRASAEVSVARPDRIGACIDHELLHALGLRYHSGIVRSVLSPAHDDKSMTAWDELALRVLYDDRLQVGMTREIALPIIRDVVAEMMMADR